MAEIFDCRPMERGAGAIARAPVGVFRSIPETRDPLLHSMQEVYAVGEARGVKLPANAAGKTREFLDKVPAAATASMQINAMARSPPELHGKRSDSSATPLTLSLQNDRFKIEIGEGFSGTILGRLIAGTPGGAAAGAAIYSLIETAKANKLDTCKYLRYLFKNMPSAESEQDCQNLFPQRLSADKLALPQGCSVV